LTQILKDKQFYKFCSYGFLKNLRFFDPFIVLFFREMGLTFLEIGILFSIREVSTNILEIPTGILADSYGRKKSMIFSFISYIVSFLIFYFFPTFTYYSVAMIFFASGEAFRTGTHKAMILQYLKIKGIENTKVEYYGRTRGCSKLGSALSSLIAALLVFHSGSFRIVFIASTVPYIAELFLMMSYPKSLDGTRETKYKGVFKNAFYQIKITLVDFIYIFKNKKSLIALLNSSTFDSVFKTTKDYLQPILKIYALSLPLLIGYSENQRTAVLSGLVFFLLYLLTSFASIHAGDFSRKFKTLPKALNITYLLGGVLLIFAGLSLRLSVNSAAIVLFILFYMLQNSRRPINIGYISELISHKIMATGLSGESQLKTILLAVFAPLIGFFADRYGVSNALIIFGMLYFAMFPLLKISRN